MALVRDERQMVVVTAGSIRPVIRIFTASGHQLGSYLWDKGRLVAWGWSSSLELLILDERGRVVVVSMHGEKLREFSMGAAVEKQGISKASGAGMPCTAEGCVLVALHAFQLAISCLPTANPNLDMDAVTWNLQLLLYAPLC